jgi:hypothetical protein
LIHKPIMQSPHEVPYGNFTFVAMGF